MLGLEISGGKSLFANDKFYQIYGSESTEQLLEPHSVTCLWLSCVSEEGPQGKWRLWVRSFSPVYTFSNRLRLLFFLTGTSVQLSTVRREENWTDPLHSFPEAGLAQLEASQMSQYVVPWKLGVQPPHQAPNASRFTVWVCCLPHQTNSSFVPLGDRKLQGQKGLSPNTLNYISPLYHTDPTLGTAGVTSIIAKLTLYHLANRIWNRN